MPELKLNIQVYEGNVNLEAMFESMKDLVVDELYKESNNGLVDFRDAELKFIDGELEKFIEFLHNANITNTPRRIAIYTRTPNQVAYVSLFSALAKSSIAIEYKIFSTFEAMMMFLEISAERYSLVEDFLF